MKARMFTVKALGIGLLFLGVMTLITGGKVITGDAVAVAAHGDFVPFVLWGNVLMGPVYITAAVGLLGGKRWGARLAQALAASTLLLALAFTAHALLGGAYEIHTAIALTVRITVLAVVGTVGHWLLAPSAKLGSRAGASAPLVITADTLVSDILEEYGDIAEVMEAFGVKRAGGLAVRKVLGRLLTVKRAAAVHRVPLEEFLEMVQQAVGQSPMETDERPGPA